MSEGRPKMVIGLVGTIGAGKTAVAALLAARGGVVVDGDKLGHAALERPGVRAELVARWGARILKPDGSINRRVVGGIVFADPAERKVLESVVFPVIGTMATEQVGTAMANPAARFLVLDAAVMFEAGWSGACDKVLFVDAPRPTRLARVANRGWTAADLAAREAAQMPAAEKKARSDAVVENTGTPAELAAKVNAVLADWDLEG
jgi:dephospho-CoA kinase